MRRKGGSGGERGGRGGEAEEQMLFRPEYLRKKEGALKIAAGATLERKAQEKEMMKKKKKGREGGGGRGGETHRILRIDRRN